MNKKVIYFSLIISALLFIVSPSFALNWGVFADYKQNINNYAMVKVVNNKPIFYSISTAQQPLKSTGNPSKDIKNQLNQEKAYIDLINTAFNTWTKDTKKYIEESGRAKEFKDIMNMRFINRPINLIQTTDKNKADFIVRFTSEEEKNKECEDSASMGCFFKTNHNLVMVDPFVYPPMFEEYAGYHLPILIHEIGHYLGLTDQYRNFKDHDALHSTTDRFKYETSVMAASFRRNLDCDDVDAFVNLIDLTLAIQNGGKFPSRAKNGWASFCNGKKYPSGQEYYQDTFYKEGKILNKKDSKDKLCSYSYDANGNITKMLCPTPFNFYNKELSYRNNVLDKAKEIDGEYSFSYSNKDGREIRIGYNSSFSDHIFESPKKIINDKEVWAIMPGYDINAYNAEGYVEIKENKCNIHNFVPNTDFKAYDLTFTDGQMNPDFTYTFLTDSLKPAPLNVTKQQDSCIFKICDEKMLKKLGKTDCVYLFENDKTAKFAAEYAAMSYKELVKQTDNICREKLSADVVNNAKALCKYYKEVDNYFDSLDAAGKKIGYVPDLKFKRKK